MSGTTRHRVCAPVLAAAVTLLAGCAAPPEVPKVAQLERAAEANALAVKLYTRGDYAAALAHAQRAYAASASVEDEEGVAASLLNLSVIAQRLGQPTEARLAVDQILQDKGLAFSSKSRADAALRRAVLAASDGDRRLSETLLKQVEQLCAAPCALGAKVLNLRAQLAIEDGRLTDAVALASQAAGISQAQKDAEEEANALRLSANAQIHLGNSAAAMRQLEAALLLDKRMGLPRKIFRDLLLLGIAAQRSQQKAAAQNYLLRAREVAQADQNEAGMKEAEALLGRP